MTIRIASLLTVLLWCSLPSAGPAQEPGDPGQAASEAEAVIGALQRELSEAKSRVADLEARLRSAQETIKQLQPAPSDDELEPAAGKPGGFIAEAFTQAARSQPYSITELPADDLERGGIRRVTRLAWQVPNMYYGESGNEARISIRGARTNRTGPEAEQVVAIFEDGISVPTTTQALGPYVDVERIDVLRGPQGVRYGRNALGGVINVVGRQPDPRGWDVALEGEYGYADGLRFDAMLNVPLSDTVTTRLAARYDLHSGFIDNHLLEGDGDDLNDRKQQFVRWTTRWQPTERLGLSLNVVSLDQNNTGSGMWGYQQIGAYVDGEYVSGHQFAPADAYPDYDAWNISRNTASLADQENLGGTLKMDWDLGFASLQWFANRSRFENQQVFDSDYSNGGDALNSDFNGWKSLRKTFSTEIRLASGNNGRFTWLAGLSLFDTESDWHWLQTSNGIFSKPGWDATGVYNADSRAAFASASVDVSQRLQLFGGGRWYKDRKTLRNGSKGSWDGVLWDAGASYRFNEKVSSYVSAATGYRPGGLNEAPGTPASYDAEKVTAIEFGVKSLLADGTLAVNLSAFDNDYTGVQAQSFTILPLPGSAGLMDYISSAGDSRARGLEAEIRWLPGSRLDVSANLAWLDAQFKDYRVAAIAGLGDIDGHSMGDWLSLEGWRPALSPEWSVGVQASYRFDLGRWGTLTPMVQTNYIGDYYANDLNLEGALQRAHSETDIRLFWDLPDSRIRLQVYVENMEEDKTLKNVMIYNPEERPGIATLLANWSDPTTFGMILSYRY